MRQHQYHGTGIIWFGRPLFTLMSRISDRHWYIIPKDWNLYRHVLGQHIFGINEKGEKFTYCPKTLLTSWSPSDYDNRWCHGCQKFIHTN